MVYLWNRNGKVVHHTDLNFAINVEKLPEKPDLELTEEEFYTKQPIRIINGKFTFGKTKEELSEEEAQKARSNRDYLLNSIQWRVNRYIEQKAAGESTTDSEADFKKITAYVKALRDLPEQKGFPLKIDWPTLDI